MSRRSVLFRAFRRGELRRLALVFACFGVAEMGAWIAITTVAYGFGGVDEASMVVVAQLAPAAVAALGVSPLVRRIGTGRVLAGGLAVQSLAAFGIAALLAVEAPKGFVYALAILGAIAVVTTRPTVATLLPSVVDDPDELTAANALVGWLDGGAMLLGPVITAIGLAAFGAGAPFVVFGVLCAVGCVVGVSVSGATTRRGERPPVWAAVSWDLDTAPSVATVSTPAAVAPDAVLPTAVDRRGIRTVLVVLAASSFLVGALDVLYVVIAVDVTDGPPSRAAWLNAAFGVGMLIGGAASTALIGVRRLWPVVVGSSLVAAGALCLVGVGSSPLSIAAVLAVCGLASAGLVVSGRTLLQRLCDLPSLCRAFSLAEAAEMSMLLVGSLLVPFMVGAMTARWSPVGVGAVVAAVALASAPALARAERDVVSPLDRIAQIRAAPLFSLLPAPTLETLARQATPVSVPGGTPVLVQGEEGDRYYVVVSGEVDVVADGRFIRRIGPRDGFGHLALLYDVPRTAGVTAVGPVELLAIDRGTFLVAVTSHAPTAERADLSARALMGGSAAP